MTKIGVTLPQFTADAGTLVDGARRAQDEGLDSVWLFDHMWPLSGGKERPIFEGWTALAHIAAATERVTVGTLVTRSTIRHPVVLAKMAATAAAVAPGRVVVAIGSGDELSRAENHAFGLPYYDDPERVGQLVSTVRLVRSYMNEPRIDQVDEFVAVRSFPVVARPDSPVPVWIGGRSAGVLAAAGRHADGWNAWGCTPAEFRRDARLVRAAAGDRAVELTWAGLVVIDDGRVRRSDGSGRAAFAGPAAAVEAHLRTIADAGADHVIVTFPDSSNPDRYRALGRMDLA